jgi:hypothetical protein
LNFKPITLSSDCKNFADTKNYTFDASDLNECNDTARDVTNCVCDKDSTILIPTIGDWDAMTGVEEACKLTCGWCGPTGDKPSGCALQSDSIVRFFDQAPDAPMPLWADYTPVCEIHRCTGKDEILSAASVDSAPKCGRGESFESDTYRTFYMTTGGCVVLIVCLAYCCALQGSCDDGHTDANTCDALPWSVHKLIWIGLMCRLTDLATDWAFWNININGDRFQVAVNESEDFPFSYDSFALGALLICIVSTVLTPIDILSKLPACGRDAGGIFVLCCKLGRKTSVVIGLIVILLEDLPQIAVTSAFVREMGLLSDDASAEETGLTIFNLVLSAISVLANLVIVVNGCCFWKTKAEKLAYHTRKAEKYAME